MKMGSWGGINHAESTLLTPASRSNLVAQLQNLDYYLPSGMARSYGDVGLLDGGTSVSTRGLNRYIAFDPKTGVLECEPGVLLREIQSDFVKRGWMLHVTPGTSFVTVGGAIANDVHGKDHHLAGTFGDHVISLDLIRTDGTMLKCSKSDNKEFFRSTIGGLGLTGFIASAKLQLKPVAGPYFDAEVIPFGSLDEFFDISEDTEQEAWQATVSWFDCSTRKAGRGSFTRGNQSARLYEPSRDDSKLSLDKGGLTVPLTPPISLINKLTLDVFNISYFHVQKALSGKSEMHYKEFYYPLDGISHWNRIYGPKGFFQYQSVVPMEHARESTAEMLKEIRKSGEGSFLGVLKTFADKPAAGMLSFAQRGVTLALDFPNRGDSTHALFAKLDRIVSEAGGRLNPSKDGRMSREMFETGFPELSEFKKYRDPNIDSDFARRVID